MKSMIKTLTSMALVLALTFSVCANGIAASVQSISDRDTPTAKLANDTYVPYTQNERQISERVKELGGYTYASESEYNGGFSTSVSASSDRDTEFEPVRQTITVMTTATGSEEHGNYVESKPVANAIVRLNGVPRFTDRKGQVRTTLDREYAELFVEKNDYNPHIEIMEVTGEEKVVHLKLESDDLEIFGVMLTDTELEPVNLINTDYFIYPDALGDYVANVEFLTNVEADGYRLLMEEDIIYASDQSVIYDIEFTNNMIGKKFYAQVKYEGIYSKTVPLNLTIAQPKFGVQSGSGSEPEENKLNPFDGEKSGGILGGFNVDIGKLLNISKLVQDNRFGLDLKAAVDMRRGTIMLTVGFSFTDYIGKNKGPDGKSDEEKVKEAAEKIKDYKNQEKQTEVERDHAQELLNGAERRYRQALSEDNYSNEKINRLKEEINRYEDKLSTINRDKKEKIRRIKDSINTANYQMDKASKKLKKHSKTTADLLNKKQNREISKEELDQRLNSIPGLVKDLKEGFTQHRQGFIYGCEVMAVFEYNYNVQQITNFALSVDGIFGYRWNGTFFLSFIPLYYSVQVQVGLNFQLEFFDIRNRWIEFNQFWQYILITGKVGLKGEVGAGINGILSVGFFTGADYSVSGYMFMPEFYTEYWKEFIGSEFEWEVGIRATVFMLLDFEFGGGERYYKEHLSRDEILNRCNNDKNAKLNSVNAYNPENVYNFDNTNFISNNSYEGSKPQIEQIGDKYVASWVDVEYRDNIPHTVLKYANYRDGVWSRPKSIHSGGDAFYHDMYYDGQNLHVTWQNIRQGTDATDLAQMCQNSEIYYASYDSDTDEFKDVRQLTDDVCLDAGPRFVLQETTEQSLAIVWQKNTANDIIGITGKNSIVYSALSGGAWSLPRTVYESDNYFSFVDTAYIGGNITAAFVEDRDNNLATNDRKLIIADRNGFSIKWGSDFDTVNHPQFYKIDGKVNLTFYGDGNIYYSADLSAISRFDVQTGIINDTYKITDSPSRLMIYYNKLSSDNTAQVFASIYDKASGKWQIDVCLTSAQNTVSNPAVGTLINGDILTVYNGKDEGSGITMLEFNVKQIRKDFQIISAFYDQDVKVGDSFTLSIGIQNIGDYAIESLTVTAFNRSQLLAFAKPLAIGGIGFINMECVFSMGSDGKEVIKAAYANMEREFILPTKYIDISIAGNLRCDNRREYYALSLLNSSEIGGKVWIDIYYQGKMIDTVERYVEANSVLSYTYENDAFENGNYVFFVVRTELPDKYESDNETSFNISHMAEKLASVENPYYESMQVAKSL